MGNPEKKVIVLEELAKKGENPPEHKPEHQYIIRIDNDNKPWDEPTITGRQILELAGKVPVEDYNLNQRMKGGIVQPVQYDTIVNLLTPGIERFTTIKRKQQEG